MTTIVVGMVWALVTFSGPVDISAMLYTTHAKCDYALQKAMDAYACHAEPGDDCTSGPIPEMRCIAMQFAPNQSVR